jgi:hypothetical protein
LHPWNHAPGAERFYEENVGHYGEDVVVGGEGCEPVHSEISYPDNEDGEVYGEDPQHEYQDGMGVVVEVIICVRVL